MYLPLLALAVVAYLAHSGKKSEPSPPVAPGPGGTPPPKDPIGPAPGVTPPPTMPDYPNIPGDIAQPTQPAQPTPSVPQPAQNLGTPMKPGSEMRSKLRDTLRVSAARYVDGGEDATILALAPKDAKIEGLLSTEYLLSNAALKNEFLQTFKGQYGYSAQPAGASKLEGRVAEVFFHEAGYLVSRQSPTPGQPVNMHLPVPGTWWLVAQYPGFNVLPSDSIAEGVSDWFEDNF